MRAFVIILDSAGIGALPDADQYGDVGASTIPNLAKAAGGLNVPVMAGLGLGRITPIEGVPAISQPTGSWGKMAELSPGKDTTTGHWELMGLKLEFPFPLFTEKGFPAEFIARYEKAIGRQTLGNYAASGTVIIDDLGEEHMKTGKPIVYTSADSVFQIAAHEEIIPIEELYRLCQIARDMLQPPDYAVGRVIARPFLGQPGSFQRTPRRHDYSFPPTGPTVLDAIQQHGLPTYGIGKIFDIFAGQSVAPHVSTSSNAEGMERTTEALGTIDKGLVFTNLVDTDMKFGHRRDVQGYKHALEEIDTWLGSFLPRLHPDDLLLVTADHGCDPTFKGSDHTREYVPILLHQPGRPGRDLGIRQGFWDVAATVAAHLGVSFPHGTSMLP